MKVEYVALLIRTKDDAILLSIGPFSCKAERDKIVSLLRPFPDQYILSVERWTA